MLAHVLAGLNRFAFIGQGQSVDKLVHAEVCFHWINAVAMLILWILGLRSELYIHCQFYRTDQHLELISGDNFGALSSVYSSEFAP